MGFVHGGDSTRPEMEELSPPGHLPWEVGLSGGLCGAMWFRAVHIAWKKAIESKAKRPSANERKNVGRSEGKE